MVHRGQFYYGRIELAISADALPAEIKEIACHVNPNQAIITGGRRGIPVGTAVSWTASTLCPGISNEGNFGYVGTGSTSEATSCLPKWDESRGIRMYHKERRSLMWDGGLVLGLGKSRGLSTVWGKGTLEQGRELSQRPGICPASAPDTSGSAYSHTQ